MKNKEVRNIAHITINTGDVVVHPDDSVIFGGMKSVMKDMVKQAKTSGIVSVMKDKFGSIEARCVVVQGAYMVTLYNKDMSGMPLLETAGALNAEAGKEVWKHMKELYKETWGMDIPDIKCPGEAFICDLLYPTIALLPWVTRWTGDFTKCFGISMLKMLSRNETAKEMEKSPEIMGDNI